MDSPLARHVVGVGVGPVGYRLGLRRELIFVPVTDIWYVFRCFASRAVGVRFDRSCRFSANRKGQPAPSGLRGNGRARALDTRAYSPGKREKDGAK